MTKKKKDYDRPKNIRVTVACVPPAENEIRKLFFDCLNDYSKRFKVPITDKKFVVHICLVEYNESQGEQGLTIYNDVDRRILIQLRDPLLNDWGTSHYVMDKFINILCPEIVHACQYLCNRKIPKFNKLDYDKKDLREQYFFDPSEMEARMLEAPYTAFYGENLV
jgi:hypothetical protein